jgi:hypothetical protein
MSNSNQNFPDEKILPHQTIVGFFCGTGYNFNSDSKSYVTQKELGYTEPYASKLSVDKSIQILDEALQSIVDPNAIKIFGYDGCHRRGGGMNATGIEQPAQHLYQHLKTLNPNTKITLILTAHSRGCLSALLLSQLINSDPQLKKTVEITLDLRDPVPGNLKGLSTLLGNLMSSGKFYDFSENTNIKSSHITVQESGIGPIGFNALIPYFSSATKLSISTLPGTPDLQERDDSYLYTAEKGYIANAGIYQLGLYKTLQIYLENNIPIAINFFISEMKKLHLRRIGRADQQDETIFYLTKLLFDLQNELIKNISTLTQEKNPESIIHMLKTAQFLIFEYILKDYTTHPDRTILPRDITFGGQSKRTDTSLQEVRYLNEEHYELAKELFTEKPHEHKLLIMLDGIKPHITQSIGTKLAAPQQDFGANANAFFVHPNPAQSLSIEIMQLLHSQGIHLDNQSTTKKILDFVMIKLTQIREQAKLFQDDDGNTKAVYQPLLDKIEKFINEKEKTIATFLESKFEIKKLSDEKTLSAIDQDILKTRQVIIKTLLAKFHEEKQQVLQLGNQLKYQTEQLKKIEPIKNKILLNAQEIINLISAYKTTDATTAIGHEKNVLALNLKNRLEKIKNDFIKFPDAKKFETDMNQAISSAIDTLKEAAVSKPSSTMFANKKDRSTRLLNILLKIQIQMQSSDMVQNLNSIKSIELKIPELKDQKTAPRSDRKNQ